MIEYISNAAAIRAPNTFQSRTPSTVDFGPHNRIALFIFTLISGHMAPHDAPIRIAQRTQLRPATHNPRIFKFKMLIQSWID
jgi:hypothetical protein